MRPGNDESLVRAVPAALDAGASPTAMLRHLAEQGLTPAEMISTFREAFGLSYADTACLGSWWPDGPSELTGDEVNARLGPRIASLLAVVEPAQPVG